MIQLKATCVARIERMDGAFENLFQIEPTSDILLGEIMIHTLFPIFEPNTIHIINAEEYVEPDV